MSYCRFSTDDFACDVYAYADVSGGFTTLQGRGDRARSGDRVTGWRTTRTACCAGDPTQRRNPIQGPCSWKGTYLACSNVSSTGLSGLLKPSVATRSPSVSLAYEQLSSWVPGPLRNLEAGRA